jgi:hypothetical protein
MDWGKVQNRWAVKIYKKPSWAIDTSVSGIYTGKKGLSYTGKKRVRIKHEERRQ